MLKSVGITCETRIEPSKTNKQEVLEDVILKKSSPAPFNAENTVSEHSRKQWKKSLLKSFNQKQKVLGVGVMETSVGKKVKFLMLNNFPEIKRGQMEFLLANAEPIGQETEELSKVLIARFGLAPRKKDGTAQMHKLLLELYERKKTANREKKPEIAVMPVEEMALHAGIKRQTMYDYMKRWLELQILKKTSFVSGGKVVIGYELNGNNVEGAFRKAETTLKGHLETSFRIIEQLQNEIKKEKLRSANPSSEGSI